MVFSLIQRFAQSADVGSEVTSETTRQTTTCFINGQPANCDDVTKAAATSLVIFTIVAIIFTLFLLVCYVKIFQKAGRKWWEAIIPIYNVIILLKIVGRPVWWVLLLLVPFVNLVVTVILAVDLAKVFKKDAAFGVLLLWLLSFIGYPMLAFGSATYARPEGNDAAITPQQPSSQPPADSQSSNSPSETPTTPSAPPSPNDTLPPTQPPQSPPTNLVQ